MSWNRHPPPDPASKLPPVVSQDQPARSVMLQDWQTITAMAVAVVDKARHTLDISSRRLGPCVYRDPAFVTAVQAFALRNRRSCVRILVTDASLLARDGHPLHTLAHRLDSHVSIRVAADDSDAQAACFLAADNMAYLNFASESVAHANADYSNRKVCRVLLLNFNLRWDSASADPNLRRLCV